MKERILSGMRPTGPLHLGHLLGALNNWVKLQEQYECLFMVADWHALMSEYENPAGIKDNTYEMVKDWVSCGIDPKKSAIFLQSAVPQHLELNMIFSVMTPLSWLERCPTYKEQLRELEGRELTTYGFLGYPVLQAADIMVYKAHKVPVGMDQLPHLELTREIVRRLHGLYGKEVFPEPEPILTKIPKLLGTDNRKMSKSYGNFIALSDSPETIMEKVSQMITDPERIRLSDKGHPDICNVFSYYKAFANDGKVADVKDRCEGAKKGCTDCKKELAEIVADLLSDIRGKRAKIKNSDVDEILRKGNKRAAEIAGETILEVKKLAGLKI
ncbi:MAG: tryptophan--tRNA ligase [Candidatus Omnitrophota bacterium]